MSAPPLCSRRHASPALLGTRASRPQKRRHPRQGARPLTLGTLVSRPQRRGGSRGWRVVVPLGTLVPSQPRNHDVTLVAASLGTLVSRPHAGRRPAKWQPDYTRNPACEPWPAEARAQAPRKPVIPAEAGIHFNQESLDSRFLPAFTRMTGNDGLKETIHPSFVRNQEWQYGRKPESTARRRTMRRHLAEDSTDPGIIAPASPAGGG